MSELNEKILEIKNQKDTYIIPGNLKKNVTVFGVTGTYEGSGTTLNNQDKVVSPTITVQNITADSGYTGLNQVTINAVTSAIDVNITANNIKNGVNILGVVGNLSEGIDTSDADATVEDLAEGVTAYVNGVKLTGTANTGTMNITDYICIDDYDINTISVSGKTSGSDGSYLIYPNSSQIIMQVSKEDMATYANLTPNILKQGETVLGVVGTFEGGGSSLKLIDGSKLAYSTFKNYPNYDVSNITDMSNMFYQCEYLENISNLDTSNVEFMQDAFRNCIKLVNISELNTSNVISMANMFSCCNNLSNASIQNIVNMCLNSGVSNYLYMNLSNTNTRSPLYNTKFDNSYYNNRLTDLTNAGWEY